MYIHANMLYYLHMVLYLYKKMSYIFPHTEGKQVTLANKTAEGKQAMLANKAKLISDETYWEFFSYNRRLCFSH